MAIVRLINDAVQSVVLPPLDKDRDEERVGPETLSRKRKRVSSATSAAAATESKRSRGEDAELTKAERKQEARVSADKRKILNRENQAALRVFSVKGHASLRVEGSAKKAASRRSTWVQVDLHGVPRGDRMVYLLVSNAFDLAILAHTDASSFLKSYSPHKVEAVAAATAAEAKADTTSVKLKFQIDKRTAHFNGKLIIVNMSHLAPVRAIDMDLEKEVYIEEDSFYASLQTSSNPLKGLRAYSKCWKTPLTSRQLVGAWKSLNDHILACQRSCASMD